MLLEARALHSYPKKIFSMPVAHSHHKLGTSTLDQWFCNFSAQQDH